MKKIAEFYDLQKEVIIEVVKKVPEALNYEFDKIRIAKARQEFILKDFKKVLEFYKEVDNLCLLNDLDKKIMEYCERHIQKATEGNSLQGC